MNNFQKLQAEEELQFKQGTQDAVVKERLQGAMGLFQFVGKIVDVYVPKVVDCLIVTIGGEIQDHSPSSRPKVPSAGSSAQRSAPKPTRPDDKGRYDNIN